MTSEKIEINDAENTATLRNPQIINGGQTVRIIGELNTQGAEVLTRIVQVPEDDEGRNFVQEMIAANNTQSPVDWVDLRANHPYQVALQRSLMREGWFFERKKREYDRKSKEIGYQFDFYYPNGVIKNVDLAQAIIAIKKNPNEAKEGADRIFEQQFDFVFKPGQDVYDFILAHQINEILRSSSRSTNVKNVDGRFSEERPMVYKHARLHALHLIFHYGNILRRKTEGKKALSKQLKEADSQATDIFDIMAHEVLSLCYQAWREGNMDAIDLFKEKETLQRLKDNFPKRNSRRIHNSINKIVTNN